MPPSFVIQKKDKSSPEVFTDLERPLEIMSDSSLSNKNDIKIGTQSILTFTRSKSEQNTKSNRKLASSLCMKCRNHEAMKPSQ